MTSNKYILGVSMSSHDRSAALLRDGRIVAAISEERIDRRKKSQGFYSDGAHLVLPPMASITHVLREAGITLDNLEMLVCGRSITTCRDTLLSYLPIDPDRVVEPPIPAHHLGHAYSAYATAPFDNCDILVIDEQGHWLPNGTFERCTWFSGANGPLALERRFLGSSETLSLGMFFDVFAALTGLSEAGLPAAGKLMALAAYGETRPDWPQLSAKHPDGDVRISLAELNTFLEQAGVPVHDGYSGWQPDTLEGLRLKFRPIHWRSDLAADLARKAQDELESALLHNALALRAASGRSHLAYAGGLALNCTANARLLETGYQDVFIHPAATDDGVAVGLAAYGWIEALGQPRRPERRFSAHLGMSYSSSARMKALERYGLANHTYPAGVDDVADLLAKGRIVCWFAGRSEWGPRALGARSILADPTAEGIVSKLNGRVKFREPFRPFGISVAAHVADELLELDDGPRSLSPYMLSVARVRNPRLHHVQHGDGTVRYQTVGAEHEVYHRLLLAMGERIGVAAVLNTSFNTLGEPLVETPQDAVRQFLLCGADALFLDGQLIELTAMPEETRQRAVRAAWADSGKDPLRIALQQEAAGYPEAARDTVTKVEACLALGSQWIRERAGLLMRLALTDSDPIAGAQYAEEVLHWSGMPEVAAAAAGVIAEHGMSKALPNSDAAQLLAALAPQGQAVPTLRAVFTDTTAAGTQHEER
ncbi:carbamoyltransferase C-terminal domain-containing protein [Gandjariella thermophila]|uniref:Nodulation protein n=1 Tax=Gandjariella thermophila TaxID=1931992 RepID=A0A4D4JI72_9PSEU|nr:carbamoyltransferase C-terminal domain-containing protein [Gandjariella thermophila]GDY33979.1 nodulation protein [Gandjariella thermophila]